MFVNLLGFNELRTEDVMVPRPDIVAVEEGATLDELIATFQEANHSRLPVFRETLDDPRGMVHIKDLLGWIAAHHGLSSTPDGEAADRLHGPRPVRHQGRLRVIRVRILRQHSAMRGRGAG